MATHHLFDKRRHTRRFFSSYARQCSWSICEHPPHPHPETTIKAPKDWATPSISGKMLYKPVLLQPVVQGVRSLQHYRLRFELFLLEKNLRFMSFLRVSMQNSSDPL